MIVERNLSINRLKPFQRARLRRILPILCGIEAGNFVIARHWIHKQASACRTGIQRERFGSAFKKEIATSECGLSDRIQADRTAH